MKGKTMKRLILFVPLFLFLPSRVHASGFGMQVYSVATSSISTQIITVSTQGAVAPGATQMDAPQLPNRLSMEIQNIDSSANLWCTPVTTSPVVSGGRKIGPGNSWIISITNSIGMSWAGSTPAKFWCLSDGSAGTKAAVTQLN